LVGLFDVLGSSAGRLGVESGDVGLDLLHEVEEVAEAGLVALLALAAGCATTKHTEQMLSAAGFKAVVPNTPQQEQHIKTLPADKLTVAHRSGKTFYVFPDPAHNRLYVGSPEQYQTYQQILWDNKIARQNRVDADMAGADGDNDKNNWAVWAENSGWVTDSSY